MAATGDSENPACLAAARRAFLFICAVFSNDYGTGPAQLSGQALGDAPRGYVYTIFILRARSNGQFEGVWGRQYCRSPSPRFANGRRWRDRQWSRSIANFERSVAPSRAIRFTDPWPRDRMSVASYA